MLEFLLLLICLFESVKSLKVLGSSGDLPIVNKKIAPDGFLRSYVHEFCVEIYALTIAGRY